MRPIACATRWCLTRLSRPLPPPQQVTSTRRGIAMLLALVTITLMSVVVVEFTYQTRVDLALASNSRDKLKSEYLARSAVNIARLLIAFQFALQDESQQTSSTMGRQISIAMRRSNFQMYQYIDLLMGPFNSGKIETPIGGVNLSEQGVEGFGDFVGEMSATVVPEDGRLNLNAFAEEDAPQAELSALCSLFLNNQYDKLFERKDPITDETLDRGTMIGRIIDFIDLNNTTINISPDCRATGSSGDEEKIYQKYQAVDKLGVKPHNAKLTHVANLHQVPGVDDEFYDTFKDSFTVYPVGKPNVNVANASVFFSILCQNVSLSNSPSGSGLSLCATNPQVAFQTLWFAMALEGIKTFFENPMTVLLGYIGSAESRLLPSAKKGQPVAFVNPGQPSSFISDMKADPALMAKFLQYSPTYSQLAVANPEFVINPLSPTFPQWTVNYNRQGLINSISTDTPKIYRIRGTGRYGSTETTVEAVVDFGQTLRRIPGKEALQVQANTSPEAKEQLSRIEAMERDMPKGRFLYWHQE